MDIKNLLKERNTQYADAWRKTGLLMRVVEKELNCLLVNFPELYYNWVIILNKLLRILGDPSHLDSWRDIAGYATLIVTYLETHSDSQRENQNEIPTS